MGIEVTGKDVLPCEGEFNTDILRSRLLNQPVKQGVRLDPTIQVPSRPPVLCPGCPHRGAFHVLRGLNLTVLGDIGCYTLGALPPLDAMDTCICMGSSITTGIGMVKADPSLAGKTVAVIGDSTFLHSGMTGLLDAVYNQARVPVLILDNQTTAMTGHQEHPGTGLNLKRQPAPAVDFVALVKALGVKRVEVVDPFDLDRLKASLKEALAAEEPSVIIARRACALREKPGTGPLAVKTAACTACRSCVRLGCPAIGMDGDKPCIDPELCTGCGLCSKVCRFKAIAKGGARND
jgi:indolepyruvate ferredoxin oxidoreductase alpha subunit